MIALISPSKAQDILASHMRDRRLSLSLTQAGLSERSNVALATLRKFEQTGKISVESLFKLLAVVGGLEAVLEATAATPEPFKTIDDVLAHKNPIKPQRGRRS